MSGPRTPAGLAAGLGLALQASCAMAATPPAPPAGPLSFLGAYVGMPREAWAALPPPGAHAAEVQCTPSPASEPGDPNLPVAADRVTCAYVRHYGRFALPVTVRLANGLLATHLRYTFEDGRLQRISYRMSVDAYDRLMSDFHARHGAADRVQRDTVSSTHGALPRVSQTWRSARGLVQIVDPVPPYTQLQVRLSALDPGAQVAESARAMNVGMGIAPRHISPRRVSPQGPS